MQPNLRWFVALAVPSEVLGTFEHRHLTQSLGLYTPQIFRATAVTKLSAPVSGSGNTTVTLAREARLSVQLEGSFLDSDAIPGPSAGDEISYLFQVENVGTTTVWSVEFTSDLVGVCNPVLESPLESQELAPGDKMNCTSTYEVGCISEGFK